MAGLWTIMPKYGAVMLFCAMGSLGLPGLAGFVSEFMVARGGFHASAEGGWTIYTYYTVLSMVGLLVTGIYVLKSIQKVLHGPIGHEWKAHPLPDINKIELLGIAPLMVVMLVLGILPSLILNLINVGHRRRCSNKHMNFPILTLIMLAPVVGAAVILLVPRERGDAIKAVAAGSLAMSLLLSFFVMFGYDRVLGGYQFVEKVPWIPSLGISITWAIDGFSAPQLLLTAVVGFCAVLVSWSQNDRPREYFAFLLALVAGVFGAFMSLDIFLMLIFYELVLFPVYVLVAGWGSKNREYAAMKLTIFLFLGLAGLDRRHSWWCISAPAARLILI